MRRTQLYLDDNLWNALHTRATVEGTTLSKLVRQALRERYLGNNEERREAMEGFIGIRKERSRTTPALEYIRSLRRGNRLDKLRGT